MVPGNITSISIRSALTQHAWLTKVQHENPMTFKRPHIEMSLVDQMNDLEHMSAPSPNSVYSVHADKQTVGMKIGHDEYLVS